MIRAKKDIPVYGKFLIIVNRKNKKNTQKHTKTSMAELKITKSPVR